MSSSSVLILLESQAGREGWGAFLFGFFVVVFFFFFYTKFEGHHPLPFQLGNQLPEHGTLPF